MRNGKFSLINLLGFHIFLWRNYYYWLLVQQETGRHSNFPETVVLRIWIISLSLEQATSSWATKELNVYAACWQHNISDAERLKESFRVCVVLPLPLTRVIVDLPPSKNRKFEHFWPPASILIPSTFCNHTHHTQLITHPRWLFIAWLKRWQYRKRNRCRREQQVQVHTNSMSWKSTQNANKQLSSHCSPDTHSATALNVVAALAKYHSSDRYLCCTNTCFMCGWRSGSPLQVLTDTRSSDLYWKPL